MRLYNTIIEEINNLGTISGLNIDDYLNLSNELLSNLQRINSLDYSNLMLNEVNTYKKNSDYIIKLNEYIKYKHNELSYTLQYQRNKKLKLLQKKSKSIYSNK